MKKKLLFQPQRANFMDKIDISKKYNLPKKVKFCKRCVISNQRPRITFDNEQICSACRYFDYKKSIDWNKREELLLTLLAQQKPLG